MLSLIEHQKRLLRTDYAYTRSVQSDLYLYWHSIIA